MADCAFDEMPSPDALRMRWKRANERWEDVRNQPPVAPAAKPASFTAKPTGVVGKQDVRFEAGSFVGVGAA